MKVGALFVCLRVDNGEEYENRSASFSACAARIFM